MTRIGRNDKAWKALRAHLRATLPPVCHICGYDIDLSISGREPLGWTLDHLKPVASNPELALDPSNLRPAHNDCNVKRWNSGDPVVNQSQSWG